jgi:hypothetical protein
VRGLSGNCQSYRNQLFPIATGRNAKFLATIQIGLNVSHTGKDYHETYRIWIPLTITA